MPTENLPLLLGGDGAHGLLFEGREPGFEIMQALHGVVPAGFERRRDQSVAGIDRLVSPFRQIGVIASALDPHPPLCANFAIPLFQARQRRERELDRHRRDRADQALSDSLVERRRRHSQQARDAKASRCFQTH